MCRIKAATFYSNFSQRCFDLKLFNEKIIFKSKLMSAFPLSTKHYYDYIFSYSYMPRTIFESYEMIDIDIYFVTGPSFDSIF